MTKLTLFFDTETSDLPDFKVPNHHPKQPWVCQLAAVLCDGEGRALQAMNMVVNSQGLPMGKIAEETHGISKELADSIGFHPGDAFELFEALAIHADLIVCHNYNFDIKLLAIMVARLDSQLADAALVKIKETPKLCTMMSTTQICQLPYPSGRAGFKWPKLEELYNYLFPNETFNAHDALEDVLATKRCYYELIKRGVL